LRDEASRGRALMPALVLFAGACAGITGEDLRALPTPEVCYIGMVREEYRQLAYDEVARRESSCEHYTAEIRAIDQALRQRAAERQAADEHASSFSPSAASYVPELRPLRRGR